MNQLPKNIIVPAFFVAFLVLGLSIFDDYGISWDEHIQRKHGLVSFDYINATFGHPWGTDKLVESEDLPTYNRRNYGVFFQLSNIFLENLLGLEDARDWYLLRHLNTFLLFWIACLFFYKLLFLRFNHWQFALLGTLLLILSPRIFGNAFFNPKDMVLLPWYIISGYTMICFLLRKNGYFAVIHAITSAMVINARITGLIIPVMTIGFLVLEYLQIRFYQHDPSEIDATKIGDKQKNAAIVSTKDNTTALGQIKQLVEAQKPYSLVHNLRLVAIYTVLCILTMIIIWPSLWENPLTNFGFIFSSMSQFDWGGDILYYGNWIKASTVPWHYGLGWMFVTTPILQFLLALGGAIMVLGLVKRAFCRNQLYFFSNAREYVNFMLLGLFLAPLLAVIILGSNLYDGWRHLYFIYPPFLALGMVALWRLNQWAKRKDATSGSKWRQIALGAIVLTSIGTTSFDMVKNHPHQNMYFGIQAGGSIDQRFDQEYWGVSS
ncbi:MAG: hypothetical protein ACPGXL_10415, partial [Chitinophagales bacterium]